MPRSNNGRNGNIHDLIDNTIPTKMEIRCNICVSIHRKRVDRLLAASFSYADIADDLMMVDEEFRSKSIGTVRKNVERHAKKHVDIKSRSVREIVERRAKEAGIIVEEATGQIATGRALLDLMINRATEQISDSESIVKYQDALEAVKMLEDFQRSEYVHQLEILQRQVWAISRALKEIVPENMYPEIADRARYWFDNPTLELANK